MFEKGGGLGGSWRLSMVNKERLEKETRDVKKVCTALKRWRGGEGGSEVGGFGGGTGFWLRRTLFRLKEGWGDSKKIYQCQEGGREGRRHI